MKKQFPQAEDPILVILDAMVNKGNPSDAILRQETRGQMDLVNSETLPKKFNGGSRSDLENIGVVFGEDADDLFVYVQLPEGWKKEATDHSMWSRLVDNAGNERAMIFYKAAFYDRDAFISVSK